MVCHPAAPPRIVRRGACIADRNDTSSAMGNEKDTEIRAVVIVDFGIFGIDRDLLIKWTGSSHLSLTPTAVAYV